MQKKIKIIPKKEFDYIYSRVTRLCVDMVIKSGNKIYRNKNKEEINKKSGLKDNEI